jgi:dihydroorotate dehydrogenase (NAD+) catalytic subunit
MKDVLKVNLGPIELKNPMIMASGTFGYGVEYSDLMDISKLGGISVKGISLEPRLGNPPPRICETPSGMLNSIGLANIGFDCFVREYMPRLEALNASVIVNTYGTSIDEFTQLASRFNDIPNIKALEINISCPNVKAGGVHFGVSGKSAGEVTEAVKKVSSLPIIIKLSPEAVNLPEVAKAVEDSGADCISMINTIRGMSIDVKTKKPRLGAVFGGLSGPAIRPLAVRLVYQVAQVVKIPIIGMGGICCLQDVLEFLLAGASAVQVGTAAFSNPLIGIELVEELRNYLEENQLSLCDLVGKVCVS